MDELLIGAHESVAGGMFRAVERAESIGATALQVFTKNSNRWEAPPLTEEAVASYKTAIRKSSIRSVVSHDSYLINLCATDASILKKSRAALADEIERCRALGIGMLNFHPGAHMGAGEEAGLRLIIESLDAVHAETDPEGVLSVVETTAGQGTVLGSTFEQIAEIVNGVADPSRMGVCIDTCHVFAAGYDISTEESYGAVMEKFGSVVGFDRLRAIHVNDSKGALGSHLDRHEHIGKGLIGNTGFRMIMTDPRLARVPKILETPKGEDLAEDRMNMKALRKLAGETAAPKPKRRSRTT